MKQFVGSDGLGLVNFVSLAYVVKIHAVGYAATYIRMPSLHSLKQLCLAILKLLRHSSQSQDPQRRGCRLRDVHRYQVSLFCSHAKLFSMLLLARRHDSRKLPPIPTGHALTKRCHRFISRSRLRLRIADLLLPTFSTL